MDITAPEAAFPRAIEPDTRETLVTPPPPGLAGLPVSSSPEPSGTTAESFCNNDFQRTHSGDHPHGEGSALEQGWQGALTSGLSAEAMLSLATGGALPGKDNLHAMLGAMAQHPTDPTRPITTADYESRVAASPDAVYGAFVKDPGRFFTAAGLRVQPATPELANGARFFLEERSTPPVWAPVEVRLDPEHHTVRLACLDGHPLRGFNEFRFEPDGKGGTRVRQHSEFQGSSAPMTAVGVHVLGLEERQKALWERVHCELSKVRR